MSAFEKIRHIGAELKGHAPFTTVGALLGIAFMLIFHRIGKPEPKTLFMIFHPSHVLLSAMVTASLFRIHENRKKILQIVLIGYFGSIGVATLSDCVLPFIGERLLGLDIPSHAALHEVPESDSHTENSHNEDADHDHDSDADHDHDSDAVHDHDEHAVHDHDEHAEHDHGHGWGGLHLGFIEDWYIVNPAAALGILIAFFLPRTKSPHALHVLLSTWATSAHMLMESSGAFSGFEILGSFVVLFIAVLLPCCISDIIFPLLFVNSDLELKNTCVCANHAYHSHEHTHEHTDECGGQEKE